MSDIRLELSATRALLLVDRPDVRNALGMATVDDLETALKEVDDWRRRQKGAVALIVAGGGRSFVSGGDLRELRDLRGEKQGHDFSLRLQSVLNLLEDLPIPVVAALNGPAVGGGAELALACDLRVIDEDAYISFAQARMGVVTGWGGGPRLVGLVGWRRALGLLASAARISPSEALAMGLADWVAPAGKAVERAEALADRLASLPPLAVRSLKPLLQGFAGADRVDAQAAERQTFAVLWGSEDHEEALASLLENRAPSFKGR
jgi:enoyl-CoA hydratase